MQRVILVLSFSAFIAVMAAEAPPVDLAFYVMSKCPDAKYCEEWLSSVATSLKPILNITVDYIAKETSPGQFSCMHGAAECTGNVQQLCSRDVTGGASGDPTRWWNFLLCQDATQKNIPDNANECATKASIDFNEIQNCVKGGRGAQLFSDSIKATNRRGIRACCTIWEDNKPRCVHDGDWMDCPEGYQKSDFIRTICRDYKGKDKPAACL